MKYWKCNLSVKRFGDSKPASCFRENYELGLWKCKILIDETQKRLEESYDFFQQVILQEENQKTRMIFIAGNKNENIIKLESEI